MNPAFYIAKRYLFAKKSHNAINIISLVAVCGLVVATTAAVCTLSVFNGFREFNSAMFGTFDPELKIRPVEGKVFDPNSEKMLKIKALPEIELITETLEENVFLTYRERQSPVMMKGVSDNFAQLVPFEQTLFNDTFQLKRKNSYLATLGVGVAAVLGVNTNFISYLEISAPKRNAKVNMANPLANINQEYAYIGGVFMTNEQVCDDYYVLVSIDLMRTLLDYTTEVSALEIKLKPDVSLAEAKQKIRQLSGNGFTVKDRFEQQEESFRMISIEKWVTFLMLCFILLVAAFNLIGSLSMLIVDKQKDIITLRNLGLTNRRISHIFLLEGWLISALGVIAGLILGVLLCIGQQTFGWIKLGSAGMFAVDAYPVKVEMFDLLLVLFVALTIGFLAAIYPSRYGLSTKRNLDNS